MSNSPARANCQHGFSMFELVVVVIMVGLLMTFAIDRILRLQVDAERVSVQYLIGTLDSAVYLQAAETVVKQGINALSKFENTNPVDYLEKPPFNYAGEASIDDASDLKASNWYYDTEQNILFYKVKNVQYFKTEFSSTPLIRLKLSLVYADTGVLVRDTSVRGVLLKSLDEYQWVLARR